MPAATALCSLSARVSAGSDPGWARGMSTQLCPSKLVGHLVWILLCNSDFHTLTYTFPHLGGDFQGAVLSCLELLRVSICFYLTCGLEDHAWPMGYFSVPRGCGVLSASEICLVFSSPFFQQLSCTPHPVWSSLH